MKHHATYDRDQDHDIGVVDFGAALRSLFDIWKRRRGMIVGFVMSSVLVAMTYAVLAEPKYTAWASIIIDPRDDRSPDGPETAPLVMTADALVVDTEVKVIRSRGVTASAVEKLQLGQQGIEKESDLLSQIADWIGGSLGFAAAPSVPDNPANFEQIRLEDIRKTFVENLKIERSGDTYAIDIIYSANDPDVAAARANAVVQAYLEASAERRTSGFERLNDWLAQRLAQLEGDVRRADIAVSEFRRANEIYEMGDDRLPSEVELASSTQILIDLRSQIMTLGARIDKFTEQIELGDMEAITLTEDERTIALEAFETRYTELLQEELSIVQQRGADSPVVADLRESQEQVRGLMLAEMRKIKERLVTRYDGLERRIADTERTVETLRLAANQDAERLVELGRLERQAEAERQIFSQLLASYNKSVGLRSFDAAPAHVIAWAVPPSAKSAPRSKLLIVLAAIGALVLGFFFAFVKDSVDQSLRHPKDLTNVTGLKFLGLVPTMQSERRRIRKKGLRFGRKREWFGRRHTSDGLLDLRFAADSPGSVMAETLNALEIQLDRGTSVDQLTQKLKKRDRGVSLGLLSSVGDEGKTTVAANLGAFLALQSYRVVLLDLDLARRGLSKRIEPILSDKNSLASLFLNRDPKALKASPEFDGLTIVYNTGQDDVSLANFEDGEELREILDLLKDHFDYIIIDTPPLQALAEATVLCWLCDKLVFLNQWGVTDHSEVQVALQQIKSVYDRLIGTIFTRADLEDYLKYNQEFVKGIYY